MHQIKYLNFVISHHNRVGVFKLTKIFRYRPTVGKSLLKNASSHCTTPSQTLHFDKKNTLKQFHFDLDAGI